jgi:hypothetical protein
MTKPDTSTTPYSIRVKDHLDLSWSDALGGVAITHQPDGTSHLQGYLPDQTALIAVLTRLNNLGVTVLSVEQTTVSRA